MRLRRHLPGVLRRLLQVSVLAFVAYTAFGQPWRNFKLAHNQARLVRLMEGEVWGTLYEYNEDALSMLGEPAEASLQFLGMPWAGRVFGFDTADPILVASRALHGTGLPLTLLLSTLLPLLLAIVLGKVFCSHLCPARLFFELGQGMRRGLLKLGVPLPEWRSDVRLGGFVLVGGMLASLVASTGAWLFVLPYVSISASIYLFITTGTSFGLVFVALGYFVFDALLAPGFFCKNVCPTGFLLEQLGRFSLLKLVKRGEEACPEGCHVCQQTCPYHLSPKEETQRPACDNCGRCVPTCPKDRLGRKLTLSRANVRRLTIMTSVLLATLALTPTAFAHHNKGLPHYGYFANYPQVPTDDYVAIDGHWEIGAVLFNFQGMERRNSDTPNDVKIYLYLYDLRDDRGYMGALDVDIVKDGEIVSSFERLQVDEESVYSTRETLPESGDYEFVAHMADGDVRLPFHVELASDQIDWWLVGGIATPVLFVFGLALYGKKRRRKRTHKKSAPATAAALLLLLLSPQLVAHAQTVPATASPSAPVADNTQVPGCACGDPAQCANDVALDASGQRREGAGAMQHYRTDDGAVMVMGGVPIWLFLLGIGCVIAASFVATERFVIRLPTLGGRDLLGRGRLYRLVKSRWFQAVPQLIMSVLLILLIYAGLFGSRVANIVPVAVWTLWWAGLIFTVLFLASAWCFVCPWDGLANLVSRLRLSKKVEGLSLNLPFPKWLESVWPATLLFALLTWLELGYGVTTNPRATAYMGLAMAGAAVLSALLWEGKRFCAHFCPVGRICGAYSNFAPVEIRGRKASVCASCKTEDCRYGAGEGYACPTGISLKVIQDSTHCTMCTECIKSCKKQNIAINLRGLGVGLDPKAPVRRDVAWLAIILLALTLFHGLSMTPAWESFAPGKMSALKWLDVHLGLGRTVSFSVGMLLAVAFPVLLYWLSCGAAAQWAKSGVSSKEIFYRYAPTLLPIALFYHLAHNLMHLLSEGGHIVPMVSDPMGDGSNFLGTAAMHVGPLLANEAIWYLQVALIVAGHVFGVLTAHRYAHAHYADSRAATRSLVPMTVMMVALSIAGLSLMHMDMNMRIGRM